MKFKLPKFIGNQRIRGTPLKLKYLLNRFTVFGGLFALIFGVDQSFKNKIEAMPDNDFPLDMEGSLGRHAEFKKFHNKGFPLERGKEKPELVYGVTAFGTALSLGGFFMALTEKKRNIGRLFGLCLLSAGALSNFFDRIRRGFVVDYIHVKRGPLKEIIFNIADAAIALGSFLWGIMMTGRTTK